jgi:phenylacetate-CoA ligase
VNVKLVKYLFFPLHERVKGKNTLACLQELDRTQWLKSDALFTLQQRKLKSFLQYAYESVPYYHRLFNDCGFVPSQVKDFNGLEKLPFLTKEIIRQDLNILRSQNYLGRTQLASTGGSTGEPVAVYWDMNRLAWDTAAQLRCHRWFGVDVGQKEAVLWGSPIEITKQDRIRSLRDRFLNTRLFSAFNLSEQSLTSYLGILQRWRPSKIYGYASVIYAVAKYLLDRRLRSPLEGLKLIIPTAEPLYDFQREVIHQAFGCPISVEYGSRDVGAIAHECEKGGLHINAEHLVVEILCGESRVAEGEAGEIVVTNMSTLGMPLIRYRTGDIGTVSPQACACGRSLPLLGQVEGRSTDFLVGNDGRLIHALSVIYILREIRKIRQFRVTQESARSVVVEVAVHNSLTTSEIFDIQNAIRKLLGQHIEVTIDQLDHIEPLSSGKHRYVISKIAPDWLKAGTTP